jgi:hypothetical protein
MHEHAAVPKCQRRIPLLSRNLNTRPCTDARHRKEHGAHLYEGVFLLSQDLLVHVARVAEDVGLQVVYGVDGRAAARERKPLEVATLASAYVRMRVFGLCMYTYICVMRFELRPIPAEDAGSDTR